MATFDIQITSDTVCPWCFVGLRRLKKAIALFQSNIQGGETHPFHIKWMPFYLNPKAPVESIDKSKSYAEKFGPERAQQIQQNLAAAGEVEDIHFSFGGKTGRTKDSHRLIAWAATQDKDLVGKDGSGTATLQSRVAEELFSSYFEKEEDITSHEVLTTAFLRALGVHAPEADQNEAKVKVGQFLATNEMGHDIDNEAELAKRGGISGVPHFLINDRFEVSGAQEPAAFIALFEKVLKLEERNNM